MGAYKKRAGKNASLSLVAFTPVPRTKGTVGCKLQDVDITIGSEHQSLNLTKIWLWLDCVLWFGPFIERAHNLWCLDLDFPKFNEREEVLDPLFCFSAI